MTLSLADDWGNQSIALFDCKIDKNRLTANLGYFRANLTDRTYRLIDRSGGFICAVRPPKEACRLREDATACIKDLPFEIVET